MEAYESQKDAADKYSLRGRVFSKLREDILSGKYKEMDELKEVMIGQELGVSRTPVREALRQLELEGLVTIVPNKGAYVTGISDQDIEDIFVIRSYLEGLCAAWACRHITKEQLDSLEEIVYLANFHIEKGNFDQVVELDNKFHELLYEACGLSDYHHYARRARTVNLSETARAKHSIGEHADIVKAIREKDEAAAEKYAYQHIEESIRRMHLAEEGEEREEEA